MRVHCYCGTQEDFDNGGGSPNLEDYATIEYVDDTAGQLQGQIDDGVQEDEIRQALNDLADEVQNIDGGDGDPIDLMVTQLKNSGPGDAFLQAQIDNIESGKKYKVLPNMTLV